MLKDIGAVPLIAGIVDGLNPCFLLTFSVILLGMLWFKTRGINRWWVVFFIGMMILDTFAFNCGFLDTFVLNNYSRFVFQAGYLIMAIIIGRYGLKFLRQWYDLMKGKEIQQETISHIQLSSLVLMSVLFCIGFVLSMMGTLWPINSYIMTFTSN